MHINGALGFIKSMQPRDEMEALLLAQMAATHSLTMTFARRLNHVENVKQQDSASNAYNKLARTFAAQMQTLKQYRSNGQQVIVQRVDVREGAQAIVGTINNSSPGGWGRHQKRRSIPCAYRYTRLRDALRSQRGAGSGARGQRSGGGRYAGCTAQAAALLKARRMVLTSTAFIRKNGWS